MSLHPLSLPKSRRLLNSNQFQRIFDKAELRVSNRVCLILARPNNLDYSRLGLVVAKKNFPLAVTRNRIKRLTRESFRQQQHELAGIDAIVLPRKGLDQHNNSDIHTLLTQLWQKLAGQHNCDAGPDKS